MANIPVVNALGSAVYLKTGGAGTSGDPHIPSHVVDSIAAALPAGTNNMGDVDVLSVVGDNADLDSGGGSDLHALVAIGLPKAGGHGIGGTATDPFRVDPTASTVQPVSIASFYVPINTVASIAGIPTVVASVHVGNFPSIQAVSIASNYLPNVVASVIGNPAVIASVAGVPNVVASVAGNPAVVGSFWQANPQATVNVANIARTITGSAYVTNWPAVQPVSVASWFVGAQVVASTIGTLFAVVNTGAAGTQNAVVNTQATVNVLGTLFAVVNTGAAGTGNMVVNTQATVNVAGGNLVASVIGNPAVVASIAGFANVIASIPNVPSVAVASFLPHVRPYTVGSQWNVIANVAASAANVAPVAARGAGVYNYVTALSVINAAASYGGAVNLCDGTSTIFAGYAAPAGGGFAVNFPEGLKPAANATLFIGVPVVSLNLYVSISGFQGP